MGFTYEVIDIMVKLNKCTRLYIRSHHRKEIKKVLVPNISWDPALDLPEFLNADMIQLGPRSHALLEGSGAEQQLIVSAWNNTDNETLVMVALNIANNFNECYGKGDYRQTSFVLIVEKTNYQFDSKLKQKARPYYEFSISDKFWCVVVCKW